MNKRQYITGLRDTFSNPEFKHALSIYHIIVPVLVLFWLLVNPLRKCKNALVFTLTIVKDRIQRTCDFSK